MLATIADLVRENAHIVVICAKCERRQCVEPFQLNEGRRAPEALPEMEAKLIADIVPKLKCQGHPGRYCGGRVGEWWSIRKPTYGPISEPPQP